MAATLEDHIPELAAELRISLGQIFRRVKAQQGLPMGQGAVLGALDRGGPQSISDLAVTARVRPQSMAQTVRELEEAGLAARRPDPADGRRYFIELTADGLARLQADRHQRDGWLSQVLADEFTASERDALAAAAPLLRRIAES